MSKKEASLETITSLLEVAREFERKGNMQSALDVYRDVISRLPSDSALKPEIEVIVEHMEARLGIVGKSVSPKWAISSNWIWGAAFVVGLLILGGIVASLAMRSASLSSIPITGATPVLLTNTQEAPKTASPVPTASAETSVLLQLPLPTATPTKITLTIKADHAALRAGPDVKHPVVSVNYQKGMEMEVLGQHTFKSALGDIIWFYVKSPNDEIGWLYEGWVNISPEFVSVVTPVAQVPTPPRAFLSYP
jgi:hypothetical protein